MGFIKHAIIGIALYEAAKYVLKKGDFGFELSPEREQTVLPRQQLRREEVDVIAGARQTDQLDLLKENAGSDGRTLKSSDKLTGQPGAIQPDADQDLAAGSDPQTPLTGKASDEADPWRNSLANDDLRAPDS